MARSPEEIDLAIANIATARLTPEKLGLDGWLRISDKAFTDGLGFKKGAASRFSDPRTPPEFGVVYVADGLGTCIAEAIVRDRKDADPGTMRMSYEEAIGRWQVFEITTHEPLRLLDLRGMGLITYGIPTDIVRQSPHFSSQFLSVSLHANPADIDGVVYQSRFFGTCAFIYDRALHRARVTSQAYLPEIIDHVEAIYRDLRIEIVAQDGDD